MFLSGILSHRMQILHDKKKKKVKEPGISSRTFNNRIKATANHVGRAIFNDALHCTTTWRLIV